VISPAFKAGDSVLSGSNGGFDFHTPPPHQDNNKLAHADDVLSSINCFRKMGALQKREPLRGAALSMCEAFKLKTN
jgi:hypothetical protein